MLIRLVEFKLVYYMLKFKIRIFEYKFYLMVLLNYNINIIKLISYFFINFEITLIFK